ncbi:MAG: O-antigen ligase family protein [Chloroflexota bacterium]
MASREVARTGIALNWSIQRQWMATRVVVLIAGALLLVVDVLAPPVYVCAVVAVGLVVVATLRYPVAGLCCVAFAVPWASGYQLPVTGFSFSPTDCLIAVLGVALLVSLRERVVHAVFHTTWMRFVVFFIAVIAVSSTQAADSHAAIREIIKWTEMGLVYLAATRFIRTERQLAAVALAVVAAGLSQALLGYVQFVFQLGPDAFKHGPFLRAYGSFDQPNPYAGFLNMTLPLALCLALHWRSRGLRALGLGAVALILGAIVVSESRGALLAGSLAIAIVLALLSKRAAFVVGMSALTALGAGLLATFNLVPLAPFVRVLTAVGLGGVSFGDVNDTNFSAVERAAHWVAGVRIFASHPVLGVGAGNYAVAYPAFHPRGWYAALDHAHNYYINIAAEAGILGLAAYILLVGSALWYSYAANRRAHHGLHHAIVLGVLGALIATSIHNLFDVLYVHGMAALFGLLVALILVTVNLDDCKAGDVALDRRAVAV